TSFQFTGVAITPLSRSEFRPKICPFTPKICTSLPMERKRPLPHGDTCWSGQVKQSGSTLIFGPSYSASRRAEHFFEALTEFPGPHAFFGQRPAATFGDLFICAKNLFVEAIAPQAPAPKPLR